MPTSTITDKAVEFWPPLVEPSPNGLFAAIREWNPDPGGLYKDAVHDDTYPDRFLIGGVRVRTFNFGEETSTGVWDGPWCSTPTFPPSQVKSGTRPPFPDNYMPVTAWAFDMCDLNPDSRDEIIMHAKQWLQLTAQIDVERALAVRLLTDAAVVEISGTPSGGFLYALGKIEAALGQTNTLGFVTPTQNWRRPPRSTTASSATDRSSKLRSATPGCSAAAIPAP